MRFLKLIVGIHPAAHLVLRKEAFRYHKVLRNVYPSGRGEAPAVFSKSTKNTSAHLLPGIVPFRSTHAGSTAKSRFAYSLRGTIPQG